MSNPIALLVPTFELDAVEAYLAGKEPPFLERLFEALDIPDDAQTSQLEIAVAQILLHRSQGGLPQWGCVNKDGKVVRGREKLKRPKDAEPLTLHPQLLLCINWADSGPGFSWPEAYHITRIPGFDKYIFTASRDSPDAYLFDAGLISGEEADSWADEVWGNPEELHSEEEEEDFWRIHDAKNPKPTNQRKQNG